MLENEVIKMKTSKITQCGLDANQIDEISQIQGLTEQELNQASGGNCCCLNSSGITVVQLGCNLFAQKGNYTYFEIPGGRSTMVKIGSSSMISDFIASGGIVVSLSRLSSIDLASLPPY